MSHEDDLEELIGIKSRRLQELRKQQAFYGISVDPHIPMEVEQIEADLQKLQTELGESRASHQADTSTGSISVKPSELNISPKQSQQAVEKQPRRAESRKSEDTREEVQEARSEPTKNPPSSIVSTNTPIENRNDSPELPVDFLIVTALEEERDAVLDKLPAYKKLPPADDDIRVYYLSTLPVVFSDGSKGDYQVVIMPLLGMGRTQVTAATADAIHRWQPRYVLLVGIAGGVASKKVKLGDILISDQIVDYELQKLTVDGPQVRWEIHRADPRLIGAIQNFDETEGHALITIPRPQNGAPKLRIGPIASGDKVIAFGEALTKYYQTWSKLIGVEMEAGGVATASFQAARPPGFFMVRGVSDLADENKGSDEVEKWRLYACDVAASYAIALLKSGPVAIGKNPQIHKPDPIAPDKEHQTVYDLTAVSVLNNVSEVSQEIQIFLCYAREDADKVEPLYKKLSKAGFKPWMDTKDILPGERWKSRIREAIQNSHFFLACLSENSVKTDGYLYEEIRQALDIWQEHIYLIPVRLEDCKPPNSLQELHWVNLFKENGWARLLEAIRVGLERRAEGIESTGDLKLENPYGTMRSDSKFYIERATDDACWKHIEETQATTLFIQAPRQMGKSSLMNRMLDQAKKELDKKSAFIDFQIFPEEYLIDEKSFLIEFCSMIGEELGIPETIDGHWQGRRTNIKKCSRYLSEYIIPAIKEPFILAMDEIGSMASSPFRTNFFGMLRTWHNERSRNENFAKMTLLLSGSIEPYLLIDNPNQSPFNVAEPIFLQDFTQVEVEELNRRHRSPLNQNELNDLIALVGGHPFLIRLALYQLATDKIDLNSLLSQATDGNGPFGNHLRHNLLRISEKSDLKQTLIRIYRDHICEKDHIFYHLKGLGLIKQVGQKVLPRNSLYARYFGERLNG